MKKTSDIHYEDFKVQDYLLKLFPGQAKTVFKWRSKTLDIKSHLTYKYSDTDCRGCGSCEESVEHIVNCGQTDEEIVVEEATRLGTLDSETLKTLQMQIKRIELFIDQLSE